MDPPPGASAPSAPRRDPYGLLDRTVGRYAVEAVLGGGGMGVVYRARDTRLERDVALKFLPPQMTLDAGATTRFFAEARAASALDHPNICTVHEIGETDDGHPFIAMAYYPGGSLRDRLAEGPLAPEAAARIAAAVARGLHRAHQAGIVHRDVKPGNVMLPPDGGVKIVDFGVAKTDGQMLTRAGHSVGTIGYMSPEQSRGTGADARADQWALGVMLHEMLTGERPFRGAYDQAVVYAILNEDPPPLPDVPEALADVVARCLAKDPAERYPDAGALADALEAVAEGRTAPAVPVAPAGPAGRRLGWMAGGVAGVVVAVGAMLAWPSAEGGGVAVASGLQQVAILPFTNVGGDADNQAFIDGLVYTVGATLTELESFTDRLVVIPTDEARALDDPTPQEAAAALGADLVVSGSVQRSDARVRLTVELYDAASNQRLGSRVLDRTADDPLALQDSVATALAALLRVELSEAARLRLAAGGTDEPEAFDLYLEARGTIEDYESEAAVDRGVELFERAVALDDDYALAWAGLGEALWRKYVLSGGTDVADRAAEAGERAVEIAPDLPPVRVALGVIYLRTGRFQEAERAFQEALVLDPDDDAAHAWLGAALYYLDRIDASLAAYRRAAALRPGHWDYPNSLGNILLRGGRFRESIPYYERVVALRPDNVWGYSNLGDAYLSLNMPDSAAYWFRRGTQANPAAPGPTATAHVGLGRIAFEQRDYAEAARAYRRATALDSATSYNWYFLGNALYLDGQERAAQSAWARVVRMREAQLEVNPNDVDALLDLAHVAAFSGRPDRARGFVDRAVALPKPRLFSYARIAWIYDRLGERQFALDSLRDGFAEGLDPDHVDGLPWFDDLRDTPAFARLLSSSVVS